MALWGITDADESKPKWLTTAQKKEIYANNSGWVVEGGSSQTGNDNACLLYTSPSPRDRQKSRMPSSA